jgi:hypothetical protein
MSAEPTFGEQLNQFSMSVDVLDSSQLQQIQQAVVDYVKDRLHASQIALFIGWPLARRMPGITEVEGWSSPSFPLVPGLRDLFDDMGRYRRQIALALGDERDLWVVSETDSPLDQSNPGKDLIGASTLGQLPTFYPAPNSPGSMTAIAWNAKSVRPRRAAVFVVEWRKLVRPTPALRAEIERLADAAGRLQAVYDYTKEISTRGTARAIDYLRRGALRRLAFDLTETMFFAYPDSADEEVVRAAREVCQELAPRVVLHDWRRDGRPGSIWEHTTSAIRAAAYGLAYLSEPVRRQDKKGFTDNLNVIMEAGMLHAVTSMKADGRNTRAGWIPIREHDSAPPPFNLTGLRMLIVPRTEDGRLDVEAFKTELRERIKTMTAD